VIIDDDAELEVGDIIEVEITSSDEHDLYAKIL